jgi:protein TonB
MARRDESGWKDKAPAALAAALVEAAIIYAVVAGLSHRDTGEAKPEAGLVALPDAPLPTPTPTHKPPPRRSREAAPPRPAGVSGRRTAEVVAPPPRIVIAAPPPFVTAPTAGSGDAASAGAGSSGVGPGAGDAGQGSGGGGSGGIGTSAGSGGRGPQRIAGALRDSDYPKAAAQLHAAGTVFVRLRIDPDGRVGGCEVTRSSGTPLLDGATCELVRKRFRYRPALDASGRPVLSYEATNFTWGLRER